MKIIKTLVQLSLGAVFGVAMVLSCSDGSPNRTDAATCDCPASEVPIAGRVVVIEGQPQTIDGGAQRTAVATCGAGMQVLSGSCTAFNPTALEDITVQQFGLNKETSAWFCSFKNNNPTTPVSVKASVHCLKPVM